MADDKSIPPEDTWEARLPFSERSEGLPFDQVNTEPIVVPLMTSSLPKREFQLLRPEDLSDDELRQVNLQITAYHYAQKLLREVERGDPPTEYRERFYVWKMLFQQLIPAGALLGVVFIVVMLVQVTGVLASWEIWLLIVTGLVCTWFGFRTYYAWAHTLLFSDAHDTGIHRPRHRWLFLTEMDLTVETMSIQTKDAVRNHFTSFFNLNSWQVSLDAPAQNDEFLQKLGFVRNGDVLKKTVTSWQRYLNQARR